MSERVDPFDQLIGVCREALDFVSRREQVSEAEFKRRSVQRRKIESAIAILSGEEKQLRTAGGPFTCITGCGKAVSDANRKCLSCASKERWALRKARKAAAFDEVPSPLAVISSN